MNYPVWAVIEMAKCQRHAVAFAGYLDEEALSFADCKPKLESAIVECDREACALAQSRHFEASDRIIPRSGNSRMRSLLPRSIYTCHPNPSVTGN
ncbi:hypothetical protein [Microseira sp. BLCC-F43]|jgi:hypothetical protein|uniref:hypothetical protein n=1 Tax=Microseira sp. BLCC-F43 TaxID=3153602 RepID=UPI0035B93868